MMRAKCSGAKRGMPENSRSPRLGERVADAQRAAVHHADHVAGPRFLDRRCARARGTAARDESRIGLPVRTCVTCMPGLETSRADAHERDAVAMLRIHVRLDLEHEAGELLGSAGSTSPVVDSRAVGGGASSTNSRRNGSTPKFVSALPKNTGDSAPASTASSAERMPRLVEQRDVVHEPLVRLGAEQVARSSDRRATRPATSARRRAVILAALEAVDQLAPPIVHADERAVRVDRPRDGMTVELEVGLDVADELERILADAVALVDER